MTEGDVSLDLEEEKREMEKNLMDMDNIKSTLVPYTLSEDSMDDEEEVELAKHEESVEIKQEVDEIKGGEELEHMEQSDFSKQEVDEMVAGKTVEEEPLEQLDCPVSRTESDPEKIEEKVQFDSAQEMAECDSIEENELAELEQVKSEDGGDLCKPIGGQVEDQELRVDNGLEEEIALDLQPPESKANPEHHLGPEPEQLSRCAMAPLETPVPDDAKITSKAKTELSTSSSEGLDVLVPACDSAEGELEQGSRSAEVASSSPARSSTGSEKERTPTPPLKANGLRIKVGARRNSGPMTL